MPRPFPLAPDYMVYPDGSVTKDGVRIKGTVLNNGYVQYCFRLSKGVYKKHSVHRVVAITFMGEQSFFGAQVAHIDGNKQNNHIRNLYWATRSQNEKDKIRHGRTISGDRHWTKKKPWNVLKGEQVAVSKITEAIVLEIRRSNDSHRVLARRYGISKTNVRDVKRRHIWKHVTDSSEVVNE